MFMRPSQPREVKECLLLANKMKDGPFDQMGFSSELERFKTTLASLPLEQIDQSIREKDPRRFTRYTEANWTLTVVSLERCRVWPKMGGRDWPAEYVNLVANDLVKQADEKFWAMGNLAQLFFAAIPLIIIRPTSSADQLRIDDGCHRAIAYYLAGFRQAFAFVGDYQGEAAERW
jgi:hypothetical protein